MGPTGFCTSCGNPRDPSDRFCRRCGNPLDAPAAQAGPSASPESGERMPGIARAGEIENFMEIVSALAASLASAPISTPAHYFIEVARELPRHLADEERLRVLVACERNIVRIGGRRAAVLAVTDERLIVLLPKGDYESFELSRIGNARFERKGKEFRYEVEGRKMTSLKPWPPVERDRLIPALTGELGDLTCPPLGAYEGNFVYPGWLVAKDRTLRLVDPIRTQVGSAGSLAVRTDLSASGAVGGAAVGTMMLGPLGTVLGLNAGSRERRVDSRKLYLLVEARDWIWSEAGIPGTDHALEAFGQAIRLAARLGQG